MADKLEEPIISLCRQSKRIGIFNGLDLVRDFADYQDDKTALQEACAWVRERSDVQPKVVYPKITKMNLST